MTLDVDACAILTLICTRVELIFKDCIGRIYMENITA